MAVTQSGAMSISMLLLIMAEPSFPNTLVPICVIVLSTVTLRQPARSGLMVLVNVHSGVGASEQPDTTSGCNDAIPVNGLARSSGTMSGTQIRRQRAARTPKAPKTEVIPTIPYLTNLTNCDLQTRLASSFSSAPLAQAATDTLISAELWCRP